VDSKNGTQSSQKQTHIAMRTVSTTLFLTLCVLLLAGSAFGQGNLQFNQVRLISTSQTVPAGKVWKVESALISNILTPAATQSHMNTNGAYMLVNGNSIAVSGTYASWGTPAVTWNASGTMTTSGGLTTFPLWLPAGTTLAASTNVTYLSVMEFNITP